MNKKELREEKLREMSQEIEIITTRPKDKETYIKQLEEDLAFYKHMIKDALTYADELEDEHVMESEWVRKCDVVVKLRRLLKLITWRYLN